MHHRAEKEDWMFPRTLRDMTSEGGFVNDFHGIARTPKAHIEAAPKKGHGTKLYLAEKEGKVRVENASGLDAG